MTGCATGIYNKLWYLAEQVLYKPGQTRLIVWLYQLHWLAKLKALRILRPSWRSQTPSAMASTRSCCCILHGLWEYFWLPVARENTGYQKRRDLQLLEYCECFWTTYGLSLLQKMNTGFTALLSSLLMQYCSHEH